MSDMCRRERIRYMNRLGWTHYIHPAYINLQLDSGANHSCVPVHLVEFVTMIDTQKPLIALNGLGKTLVNFITETSEGHILIDVPALNGVMLPGWMIFDQQGKFVRSHNGCGTAVTLENKVEKTVEYIAVNRDGRRTAGYHNRQLAWDVRPGAMHLIQIDMEDGVVVGVGVLKRNQK